VPSQRMHAALDQKKAKATLLMLPPSSRVGFLLKTIVEPLGLPSLVGDRQTLIHRCLSGSIDFRNDSRKNCLNLWAVRGVIELLEPVRIENWHFFRVASGIGPLPLDDFVECLLRKAEVALLPLRANQSWSPFLSVKLPAGFSQSLPMRLAGRFHTRERWPRQAGVKSARPSGFVLQLPLHQLTGLGIHHRDLLIARVKITSCNQRRSTPILRALVIQSLPSLLGRRSRHHHPTSLTQLPGIVCMCGGIVFRDPFELHAYGE
jgi:hypothetical protein